MNVLDALIVIVAILFALNGFFRGFIHQIFFLLAIFAGIAGAMHLSPFVGEIFSIFTKNPDFLRLLGFALSFVVIAALVGLLGRLVHRGFRLLALGWLDHVLGAVFGLGAALLFTAFGVYVLKALLPSDNKLVRGSTFAPHAEKVARGMLAIVPVHLQTRFREKLEEIRKRREAKPGKPTEPSSPASYTVIAPKGPPASAEKRAFGTDLVDVRKYVPGIRLEMRYATTHNFLKQKLYRRGRCYLKTAVAIRLGRVQKRLRKKGLGLKVWDCYRPLAVQWKMWNAVPKPGYVADPREGSNHNRGAAVDVTLVDAKGRALWMPTDFDEFSPRAHHGAEAPTAAVRHRQILREAMTAEGFAPLPTEWWHYDAPEAQNAPILDVPLELLP